MGSVTENVTIKIREDGSRVVSRNIRGMGGAALDAESGILNLQTVLLSLASGATLFALASMADEFTNLQNRLRLVTTDSANLARVTSELGKIANATRSDFSATAELYARMATSSKELGLSQQELLQFTKSLNQAVILSGASAEEAAGGIRQLSQGMASGTLRGDELNSVLENLPAVADIIAKGLGITRGQLREMGKDGKLTATQIVDAFAKAKDELETGFGTTVPTLSQAFTVMKNNFMLFIGEMDKSYGITAGITSLMMTFANNINIIVPLLAGLAAALATAFAPAVIVAFMNQIKALWLLMMANPFVALAALIAGVVTSLYLMRDAIKLGIDDTTTLGDLMRAAWESTGPIIQGIADTVVNVWGFITDTVATALGNVEDNTEKSTKSQEALWLRVVRTVAQVFDMIGGTVRGVMRGIFNVVSSVVGAMMNSFKQLGNALQGALELDPGKIADAFQSSIDGAQNAGANIGKVFSEGFQQEVLSQSDSGLESVLNNWISRAQEIGKERLKGAALGGLGGGGTAVSNPTKGTDDAAKAMKKLADELDSLLNRIDPVRAAQQQLAQAEVTLEKAVRAGMLTRAEATGYLEAYKEQLFDQLYPLQALIKANEEEMRIARMLGAERQIEINLQQQLATLKASGIKVTEDETAALRAQLVVMTELNRIGQMKDSLAQGSMKALADEMKMQAQAMAELLQDPNSGFTGGDAMREMSAALGELVAGTSLQLNQNSENYRIMYEQINAYADQHLINEQTRQQLLANLDKQLITQRLQNASAMFGQLAGLSRSSNQKLAKIGKAAAIVQATIDGVLAVQKAWASAPYPYNLPAVAITTVTSAANVAAIASSATPAFRTGGEFTVGGRGGIDSSMVAFRATPGEKVRINTPAQERAAESGGGTAPQVNVPVTIVNVDDPQRYVDAMDTGAGKNSIMNHMQSDPAAFRRALGV